MTLDGTELSRALFQDALRIMTLHREAVPGRHQTAHQGSVQIRMSCSWSGVLPPERPVSDLADIGPVKLARQVDGVASLLGDRNRR